MADIIKHDLRSRRTRRAPTRRDEDETGSAAADEQKPRESSRRTTSPQARRQRPPQDKKEPASKPKERPPQRRTTRRTPPRPASSTSRSPQKPKITHPVIGVTCSFQRLPSKDNHDCDYHYLYDPYIAAIHQAGGMPIIIPVGLEGRYINRVFDLIDGLCITGGGDIDPNLYNDLLTTKLYKVEPKKDRTELDIFNLSFNRNIPILGICRGAQLMNVALDGTLYQDIVSQVRMALNHNPDMTHAVPAHTVEIEPDTKLHRIIGEDVIKVNSWHHQGIKLHGKGLISSAKAPDGLVEAIEHPNKKWCIGVQWHPEMTFEDDKHQAKLFKAFVDACKS